MTSKKTLKMTYFFWILVYMLIAIFVSINSVKTSSGSLFDYDDSRDTTFFMANQMEETDGSYHITGNDGFVVFSLEEELVLWNGCILFESKLDQNVNIEIFYTDEESYFNQEDSFLINAAEGEESIIFPLPEEEIKNIRVDVMPQVENQVPLFSLKVVEHNNTNVLFAIFSLNNVILILALILIIILVRKTYQVLLKKGKSTDLVIIWSVVSLMFYILYGKFIAGDVVYIYSDIGRDTMDSYWPRYLLNLEFVKEFENFGYTLRKGFGEFISDGIIKKFSQKFN